MSTNLEFPKILEAFAGLTPAQQLEIVNATYAVGSPVLADKKKSKKPASPKLPASSSIVPKEDTVVVPNAIEQQVVEQPLVVQPTKIMNEKSLMMTLLPMFVECVVLGSRKLTFHTLTGVEINHYCTCSFDGHIPVVTVNKKTFGFDPDNQTLEVQRMNLGVIITVLHTMCGSSAIHNSHNGDYIMGIMSVFRHYANIIDKDFTLAKNTLVPPHYILTVLGEILKM
jgi:hypothetical protein